MDLQIGSTVGDYQVVGILGAGGMGKVYKVRNVISDRMEAMKVLLPDLATAPELADRFLREIKVQASLEHPNIASLHTALRVENQLLMLMEFVEGETLEQKLKAGPIPVAAAADYIMQVLSALDYAHQHGVIHRDIKPANMMLTPGGVVKLMDFGIAKASSDHKLTMTGTTMGSLYYMSPEQIQGAVNLDARADLYSVGVSLYELVTGKRPFDGDSQFAIMSAHLEKTPVPPIQLDPRLPQGLNDAILMSVAKDPNARFQTAGAFRNALSNLVPAAQPVAAAAAVAPTTPMAGTPPVVEPPRPAPARSKRGMWMAIGAVVTAIVVVALIQFGPFKKTTAAPQSANPAPVQTAAPPMQQPAPVQQAAPQTPTPANPEPVAPPVQQAPPATQPAIGRAAKSTPRGQSLPGQPQANQPPVQSAQPMAPVEAPPRQAAPAGPSREELQAIREQLVMLNTRASGIHTSLDSLRRAQAAGGMNLRGDMQEASGLMTSYLEGAHEALNAGDASSARSFMDKAERQIEKLEKFLNR